MCKKLICYLTFVLVLGLVGGTAFAELVAYYPLDEGSGTTAEDATGNGHDGTLRNGATWIQPGYFGDSAINVDGNAGSRVAIGTWDPSEGTGQLSLALWVKWSGEQNKSDHQGLIGKRDSWSDTGALRWFLEVRNNGRIHMRNYNQGVAAPAGTLDPFVNIWAHIAVTFDGTTARIYLNGEEQASGEFSLHDKTDAAMGIGCTHGGSDGNQEVFSGDLDEVYIFNNPVSQAQIQDLANGIVPIFPKARWPQPEDGATLRDTWTSFSWKAGDGAASHDLYLGESFADVNEGTGETFQGNQTGLFFIAGFPGYPYPDGFVPGTTYYWRIDEVEADDVTKHKGDVWSFFISPKKAYDPNPMDGAALIATDVTLSYSPGFGVKLHHVYFGENFADVEAGTPDTYKGPAAVTSFVPGTLEFNTTYYWRIDEFDGFTTHTGDVWSFQTTQPGLGTIVLEIWENITGSSVDNLKDDPRYPGQPDSTQPVTELAWDPDMDNYGGRILGWLYAPLTGDYTFWLTSDNNGELWLSTNDDPENIELIASVTGWAGSNEWNKFSSQMSDPVSLTAGSKYYVMALWKEQDGGDHCRVAWQGPGIEKRTVIAGDYLSPYEPVNAYGPNPGDGAAGVERTPTLTWKQGIQAASHEVYFGTDEEAVRNATTASPEYMGPQALGSESYEPGKLAWESTYYWRVDEVNSVNPDSPWIGGVWSFTTADFIFVDDFESYNDIDPPDSASKRIFDKWIDGFGTTTNGALVGNDFPPYAEQTVVHGGAQSMIYRYDNNLKTSEATLTLVYPRDWTEEGVAKLSLWFRGYPASVGSFVEGPAGTYTMTASGADITGTADEFHFAYKMLTGPGSIVAKVESMQNTNQWAKAGVMIRETLDPGSAHAMAFVTPGQGVVFEYRPVAGDNNLGAAGQQTGITAPHWLKLERSLSGNFTASHSADGSTWQPIPNATMPSIQMNANVYIGLALTAHDAAQTCEAVFSNVTFTGTVDPQWMNQDIGVASNDPEPMYVAVSNSAGAPALVYHDDPAAAQSDTWTEWVIPLQAFADQGINLANVNTISIGFGTKNASAAGGSGQVYFDDIRLYR